MKTLWAIFSLTILLASLPSQSYSQGIAGYNLEGIGYSISDQETKDAIIKLHLDNSKTTLQEGQFQIGDKFYSIKSLDLLFFKDGKFFRIDAVSNDGAAIKGTGRMIMSNTFGTIYQINGMVTKDSFSEKIILSAMLTQNKQQQTTQVQAGSDKEDVLLLVKHFERVDWKSLYKFTARTFEPASNPQLNFDQTSGYLEGISISATITDPTGKIIKTSDGLTQKFGYFEDSILIPDNARTGLYTLNVTTSGNNFKTTSKELTFVVSPLGET